MANPKPEVNLKLEEIQGIILRGYKRHSYSNYLFLQIEDAEKTKQWLEGIIPEVTTSVLKDPPRPKTSLNIAFSYAGLTTLGYSDETKTFSREFQEGMPEENRARILGDTGESDPKNWEMGGMTGPLSKDNLHILLMLYGEDWASLDEYARSHRKRIDEIGGLKELYEQDCYINPRNEEPFGFRDGLSQPAVEGFAKKQPNASTEDSEQFVGDDVIQAGEFILGYPNAYEQLPITPTVCAERDEKNILPILPPDPDKPEGRTGEEVKDFGQNGSYLVYRKLEEKVADFWKFMNEAGGSFEGGQKLAAKFMGRWPSGTPLVLAPDKDDPAIGADATRANNFKFHNEDPEGFKCPIGSHIRRSNPRDSLQPGPEESTKMVNRHRVIRRGRPYGMRAPDDPTPVKKGEREGIVFIAINASIKRQFEFIQQMWVDDQKFDGLYDNKDAVTGDNDDSTIMTIQARPVRKRIKQVPRFVQVKGGGYFFIPSITALKYLAGGM